MKKQALANGPCSVEFNHRRILINGTPNMVLAGEVHYFRLAPELWEDRLQKLQDSGLDTVATYIPWVWHELAEGVVDLTGTTHPQRDLVSFLQLCAKRGLHVIARPGPFVMAELKNEGIPYRLYKEPFKQPVTWNGAIRPTRTLDYLAPDFLAAVKGWYSAVMPILAANLKTRGGPVIAVQLDNEIGMLSWVSNSPDLTDVVLEDSRDWSRRRYGDKVASGRAGVDVSDPVAWAANLRAPGADSLPLHQDLGLYMRDRFRRYVATLRQYAEANGVVKVPFLVNLAGTGGLRARTFPICISQLYDSYRHEPQMTAGSDLYLGDLTVVNVADLYLSNAFMLSVQGPDQPLMSLEFEAGNGNYGDDLGVLYTPEAIDLKTRLCVAQGNRALNYYLHAGGENPPFATAGDGIDRIAFTGQRHGFAAPVGPEGNLNATYAPLGRAVAAVRGVGALLAESQEEFDDLAIGFVPDHYMSEYHYPGAATRTSQIQDLERYRGFGPRDVLARALLLNGFSFPAIDLQARDLQAGVPYAKTLVLATGRTLGREVQQHLVEFIQKGGKLLLVGLLPDVDHDGVSCTLLADALGLKSAGRLEDAVGANGPYWPTVRAHDWAAPRPEVRVSTAQLLSSLNGEPLKPLLTEIASGQPCAVHVALGAGECIVLGCDYPADLGFYRGLLAALGVTPRWQLDASDIGVVVTSTISPGGQRLLHLVNVAPYKVSLRLRHHGKLFLAGKRLQLPARSGLILPLNVKLPGAVLKESTAEVAHLGRDSVTVRPTQDEDVVLLSTDKQVSCRIGTVHRRGSNVRIVLPRAQHRNKPVKITLHGRGR